MGHRVRVDLFATCLVDQLWPSAGMATVRLLERAGCQVGFDERLTCCGQPAFNAGFREEARAVARRAIELLEESPAEALVMPSGSCAAMTGHWPELFASEPDWRERALRAGARVHELSRFLVRRLEVLQLGARFDGRIAWHDACHGLRELGIRDEPRRLLAQVAGAELVLLECAEHCCGFGGTFSVRHPEISTAMLDRKLAELEERRVDAVISGDVGCLMQIEGRLARRGSSMRALHLAELLAGSEAPGE
jgi:L-lactate dehydrogenase complex protein LldE